MIDPATVPPIRPANVLAAPPPDLDSPFNGTSAVVGRNTPRFPTRRARGRPGPGHRTHGRRFPGPAARSLVGSIVPERLAFPFPNPDTCMAVGGGMVIEIARTSAPHAGQLAR